MLIARIATAAPRTQMEVHMFSCIAGLLNDAMVWTLISRVLARVAHPDLRRDFKGIRDLSFICHWPQDWFSGLTVLIGCRLKLILQ